MRTIFAETVLEIMKRDKNIVFLTGDLGFGALDKIMAECPENFINCGVAEQNMTGIAAGLALEGKTVITYSIANFATLRCLEQIRNDVAYHRANVKVVAVGGGLSYGALGFSHHATEDLSIMRAIPNMAILCPSTDAETRFCTEEMLRRPGPAYLRLDKLSVKEGELEGYKAKESRDLNKGEAPRWAEPRVLVHGERVAIVSAGGVSTEGLKFCAKMAGATLAAAWTPTLVTLPVLKPLNTQILVDILKKHELVVTLEENQRSGGLGSLVAEALVDHDVRVKMRRLCLEDQFLSTVGSQEYLRRQINLTAEGIEAVYSAGFKN